MTSSALLQRQAEASRAELSSTLDELRLTMTRAALAGGATALAREGSATVARAVVQRATDNPLAALMIGAGIVMLFSRSLGFSLNGAADTAEPRVAETKRALGDAVDRATDTVSDTVGKASAGIRGAAATAAGTVTGSVERAGALISQGQQRVGQTVGEVQQRVGQTVDQVQQRVGQTVDQVQARAIQTREHATRFIQEQPVVAAALAVAAGAALGAILPVTEAERRYLGPAAVRVTEKGRSIAGNVAEAVVPKAADAATEVLSAELGRGDGHAPAQSTAAG